MIIYEVTTVVSPASIAAYESYMRETHVRDVLATGCFVSATISRAMPGRYRIRYAARSMDVLDRYLGTYAQQFRSDFAEHLGSGVEVTREVWTELQHWDATPTGTP